jgi:hypothetical protein
MEKEVAAAAYQARLFTAFPNGMYVAPRGDNPGRYMLATSVTMDGDVPVIHAYGPALKDYDLAFESTTENPDGTWDVDTDGLGHVQIRSITPDESARLRQALEEMYG